MFNRVVNSCHNKESKHDIRLILIRILSLNKITNMFCFLFMPIFLQIRALLAHILAFDTLVPTKNSYMSSLLY